MQTTQRHVGKMEEQLKHWGAKLDELVAKADAAADAAGAEAEVDYRKRIDALRAKHKLAQAQLDDLKSASSEKWETIKDGAEAVWKDLETAFEKLKN